MKASARQAGFLAIGLFITVFLLALKPLSDTDSWTHLSFGRWIWEHGEVPSEEPFVETSPSSDRHPYYSWLFGLVYYAAYLAGDIQGVILLKALLAVLAFYILYRDSLLPHRDHLVSAAVSLVIAIAVRGRFVERPDAFLMIFLPFTIFALNAFVYHNRKRYLFLLPAVLLLWGNSHTSVSMMLVPFLAFLAGGSLQRVLQGRGARFSLTPTPSQLGTILIVFIVSFGASLVSPYGLDQYLVTFRASRSDWWRHTIAELIPPVWPLNKMPFIMAAAVLLSFVASWFLHSRAASAPARDRGGDAEDQTGGLTPSLIHLMVLVPFVMLAFSAKRFVYLFFVVAGPALARSISSIRQSLQIRRPALRALTEGRTAMLIVVIGMAAAGYWAVQSTPAYGSGDRKIGFGIDRYNFPERALQYMDRRNIVGKMFNEFSWGGYISWRDHPRRTPFIDGRGFTDASLLERYGVARGGGDVLDGLSSAYRFEIALLTYPLLAGKAGAEFTADGRTLNQALFFRGWALVYWDDLSRIYVKRGGRYDALIREDEYRFVDPAIEAASMKSKLRDAKYRKGIIRDLKRNIDQTGSSKAYALLGALYNELGMYREAIEMLSKVKAHPYLSHIVQAYNGLSYAYFKLEDFDSALRYLEKGVSLSDDAAFHYRMGTIYLKKGDKESALRSLETALDRNGSLLTAYPLLIGLTKELRGEAEAGKIEKRYRLAIADTEGEEHFKKGVQFYLTHKMELAKQEFLESIEKNPENPAPYANIGYLYYDEGDLAKSHEFHTRALELDPNHANAHYGIALVYKQWGEREKARSHWDEYIRLEPRGYYTRRAQERLMELK